MSSRRQSYKQLLKMQQWIQVSAEADLAACRHARAAIENAIVRCSEDAGTSMDARNEALQAGDGHGWLASSLSREVAAWRSRSLEAQMPLLMEQEEHMLSTFLEKRRAAEQSKVMLETISAREDERALKQQQQMLDEFASQLHHRHKQSLS